MILCKDCKWNEGYTCTSPKRLINKKNVVTGKHDFSYKKCSLVRQGGPITKYILILLCEYECGQEARWFEEV